MLVIPSGLICSDVLRKSKQSEIILVYSSREKRRSVKKQGFYNFTTGLTFREHLTAMCTVFGWEVFNKSSLEISTRKYIYMR